MKKLLCFMLSVTILATVFCLPATAESSSNSLTLVKTITGMGIGNNTQGYADGKAWSDGVFSGVTNASWSNLIITFGLTDVSAIKDTGYIGMKVKTSSVPTKVELAIGNQEPISTTSNIHYTKNNTTVTVPVSGMRADEWYDLLVPISSFSNMGKCYVAHADTEWTSTHEIPFKFEYLQNLQLAITAGSGSSVEVKDVCLYNYDASSSEETALDIFAKRLSNTSNSRWTTVFDGARTVGVTESVDPITNEKYVGDSFVNSGSISLESMNSWSGWKDWSSYRSGNYYLKLTLKVPEGKMPTNDITVKLYDSNWKANAITPSVKSQVITGDWCDVYLKLDTFSANNADGAAFKFNDLKQITISATSDSVDAELYLKGISICSKNDIWWNPLLNGKLLGSSITKADPWDYTSQAIAGYTENMTDGYLTIVPNDTKTASFFEINTTNSVNLSQVYSDAFLRIKMKSTEVPSEFHVCGMKGSYNGGVQKITISSWKASTATEDNWFVLDIPATTFLKEALVNSQNRTITGFNFKFVYAAAGEHAPIDIAEIAVYGPERKFEVIDFKIKKGSTVISEYAAGDELTLSATVNNTISLSKDMTVIGALYNDDGLINLQPCSVTSTGNSGTVELTGTYTIPTDATGTTFRAFVWDNLTSLTPLFESVGATQVQTEA